MTYDALIVALTQRMGEAKTKANRTSLDRSRTILNRLEHAGFPCPVLEVRFAPPRMFRFDFGWAERGIALEFEGGTFTNGGHTRGKHYESDCEKYNLAASLGWRVVRVTVDMVKDGRMVEAVERVWEAPYRLPEPVVLPEPKRARKAA